MSRLAWDETGEHFYETGVDRGVLYPQDNNGAFPEGVAWNGLTGVTESPEGADTTTLYADNIEYLNLLSAEKYKATIEAYTYPDEFKECDGSKEIAPGVYAGQQNRKAFGFCYRTILGNDVQGNDYGYLLHLVYNGKAAPSERAYDTVNDSPEAITFSWEVNTTPIPVPNAKPSAHFEIDSTKTSTGKMAALEGILYGADTFSASSTYKVGDVVEYTTGEGAQAVTKVYVCKTAISTAAAWDATKWDEVGAAGPRLPLPSEVITIMTPAS